MNDENKELDNNTLSPSGKNKKKKRYDCRALILGIISIMLMVIGYIMDIHDITISNKYGEVWFCGYSLHFAACFIAGFGIDAWDKARMHLCNNWKSKVGLVLAILTFVIMVILSWLAFVNFCRAMYVLG